MSTVTELTQTAQDQTLAAVKQSQTIVVEAVRTWAQAVEKAVPEVPALPFVAQLPSPAEIVSSSFAFAEELLKAQREFAEQIVAAASPVLKTAKGSE
jgi:hypothetical protein